MNKEQLYDTHISPLVSQIIAKCMEHGIACLLDFEIPVPHDANLRCTTAIPAGDNNTSIRHIMVLKALGFTG